MSNTILAGFAQLEITPPFGLNMAGYFEPRSAAGILDPLYTQALAVGCGSDRAVIIALDLIGINQKTGLKLRETVSARTGLNKDAVFYACSHTHTGPDMGGKLFETDDSYNDVLFRRIADAACMAINDMKPAKINVARNVCEGISFVRRFRMKSGKIQTNPGLSNPDIVGPIGTPDEEVQLIRIERDNASEILLVNFQVHPDVIGGNLYSADYPGFVRKTLESALPSVHCIFLNGAQGDTNHLDVRKKPENASKGYAHSAHMGRSIAGSVLQIYGDTNESTGAGVGFIRHAIEAAVNREGAGNLEEAEKLIALHEANRRSEIPYSGMEYTTVIAEAYRQRFISNAPDTLPIEISVVRFGNMAVVGIPGEPFTDIGREIKKQSPFEMTIICCCAGGSEGYYPMRSAYNEGGYEARNSRFKEGVAEQIIEKSVELLNELYEEGVI